MYLKHLLAGSLLALGALWCEAQTSGMDSPMTQAVMKSYQEMLTANPKDYQVYFRRANEYYNHNEYSKALADINEALTYAPAKEKDIRFQCYSLRASIYERMKMYDDAVNDLVAALQIDPSSYAMLYQKANIEYRTGNYAAAKADYQKLQRLNTRSQEALFGLARVAVKDNDKALAEKYIDEAVALTPTAPESYMRRASVKELLGDNTGAVEDYIVALNLSKGNGMVKPLQALVDLSYTDYNAVMNGLGNAINKAPRQGEFYYIRGLIAKNHAKYPAAISDLDYILDNRLYEDPSIYRALAECYYALGDYEKALDCIDEAIGSTRDNRDSYIVKSDIKRATRNYRSAIADADRALAQTAGYAPALVAKALAQVNYKFVTEASTNMGNAVLADPEDPYYQMIRAWMLTDYLNQPDAARSFYEKVIALNTYPANDPRSLKGFAMLYTGDTAGGDAWIEDVIKAAESVQNGEAEYYATCYYAARGDKEKAFENMQKALKKGYANYHNWTDNNEARVNVAPLRNESRFNDLLNLYSFLFKVPGK